MWYSCWSRSGDGEQEGFEELSSSEKGELGNTLVRRKAHASGSLVSKLINGKIRDDGSYVCYFPRTLVRRYPCRKIACSRADSLTD